MRRAARTVAALILAAACVAGALELGVRLYYFGWHASPKELLLPSDDPLLCYELQPGLRGRYTYLNPHQKRWPWSVSVNERGFRGPELAQGDTRPRVLVLGDSYAFGYGVDDSETFPHHLGERLGRRAAVLNWGVPGYNLVQQVRQLERNAAAWHPTAVVVAMHPNDLEPPVFDDAAQLRMVRLSHLYSAYLHLRFVAGEDVEEALARSAPERRRRAREGLDRLIRASSERDFGLLLFQTSCWSGVDDVAFRDLLRRAKARGVLVVAADPAFCAHLEAASIPDDGHPTREGHVLLADRVEPRLRALLRSRGTQ